MPAGPQLRQGGPGRIGRLIAEGPSRDASSRGPRRKRATSTDMSRIPADGTTPTDDRPGRILVGAAGTTPNAQAVAADYPAGSRPAAARFAARLVIMRIGIG